MHSIQYSNKGNTTYMQGTANSDTTPVKLSCLMTCCNVLLFSRFFFSKSVESIPGYKFNITIKINTNQLHLLFEEEHITLINLEQLLYYLVRLHFSFYYELKISMSLNEYECP